MYHKYAPVNQLISRMAKRGAYYLMIISTIPMPDNSEWSARNIRTMKTRFKKPTKFDFLTSKRRSEIGGFYAY